MSRTTSNYATNPAVANIKWVGSEGLISIWDKETREDNRIKPPFSFIVLDILSCVTGYSDADKQGLYSNEVRNTKTDKLYVRLNDGTNLESGLYSELTHNSIKYCASVYVAFYYDDELVIGSFRMYGSALNAWIEFRKRRKKIYEGGVKISAAKAAKKGATKYFVPVFEVIEIDEKTSTAADELDRQLQEYLTQSLSYKPKQTETQTELDYGDSEPVAEAPKSRSTGKGIGTIKAKDIPNPPIEYDEEKFPPVAKKEEEPIDDNDLPF